MPPAAAACKPDTVMITVREVPHMASVPLRRFKGAQPFRRTVGSDTTVIAMYRQAGERTCKATGWRGAVHTRRAGCCAPHWRRIGQLAGRMHGTIRVECCLCAQPAHTPSPQLLPRTIPAATDRHQQLLDKMSLSYGQQVHLEAHPGLQAWHSTEDVPLWQGRQGESSGAPLTCAAAAH